MESQKKKKNETNAVFTSTTKPLVSNNKTSSRSSEQNREQEGERNHWDMIVASCTFHILLQMMKNQKKYLSELN